MTTFPLGDVKSHLSELVGGRPCSRSPRAGHRDHTREPSVILIAPEDLKALEETLAIMRVTAIANRLGESNAELARCEYVSAQELAATMRRRQASRCCEPICKRDTARRPGTGEMGAYEGDRSRTSAGLSSHERDNLRRTGRSSDAS
jgi:antitoxin YefM